MPTRTTNEFRHDSNVGQGTDADSGEESGSGNESRLDRGTKIYVGILAAIALTILVAWLLSLDPRVWEINDRLEQDPEISAYTFPFRVLEFGNGVAVVSSPRSSHVSVMRFLGILDPNLRNADPDSPAAIAAQKNLAHIQGRVRQLIQAEPDIDRVSWRVDTDWFAAHGVQLQTR